VGVSAFIVSDEADAVAVLADTVWDHYGLATAGTLRHAGYQALRLFDTGRGLKQ